jgi:hypothetical protein
MDQFHFDPEVQEVAQLHIEKVAKLEESEARKLLKKYREVRQELRDRLDTLPRETFSAQHVRSVLVQVNMAIDAMTERLKGSMGDSAPVMAEAGVEHLVKELNHFNKKFTGSVIPIKVDAVAASLDTSNFLFEKYDSSWEAFGTTFKSRAADVITNALIEQTSVSEIVQRLGKGFAGYEWELHRIARTELHNVYNVGKLRTMGDLAEGSIPDLFKTLMHPMDSRTAEDSKLAAKLHLIVPVDEPFEYEWEGKLRSFMAPPDRPNDRAILVPYREEWGAMPSKFSPS